MNKGFDVVEDSLIVCGMVISIDQLKTILGIVLLLLQIALIVFKIIKYLRKKEEINGEEKTNWKRMIEFIKKLIKHLSNKDGTNDGQQ